MAESDLIYKITTLHILSKADFPISNRTICEFFIDGGYTDYFNVQQAISNLLETGMIENVGEKNRDKYCITESGRSTLELFSERITDSIEADVVDFFKKKGMEMRCENLFFADYYKAPGGGFYVHCRMSEEERNVMDMTFHVLEKSQAEAICMNWEIRHEDVYATLMDTLM